MAPTVIHIDNLETLFIREKKAKDKGDEEEFSPTQELRKAIGRQLKALKPGERVLVVANSSNPIRILILSDFMT